MIINNRYSTYDVYVAAFLILNGAKADASIDKKRRILFQFNAEDGVDLGKLIDKFNEGEKVDVLKYSNTIKALKNQIYALLREEKQ